MYEQSITEAEIRKNKYIEDHSLNNIIEIEIINFISKK